MVMFAESDRLYRHIQTKYFASKESWGEVNFTYSEGLQLESVVTDMVDRKFGGYSKNSTLTIGSDLYVVRALPPQNKHQRKDHAYSDSSYAGTEHYVNIMVRKAGGDGALMLNMHIPLRTVSAEKRINKKIAKSTPDDDGWTKV